MPTFTPHPPPPPIRIVFERAHDRQAGAGRMPKGFEKGAITVSTAPDVPGLGGLTAAAPSDHLTARSPGGGLRSPAAGGGQSAARALSPRSPANSALSPKAPSCGGCVMSPPVSPRPPVSPSLLRAVQGPRAARLAQQEERMRLEQEQERREAEDVEATARDRCADGEAEGWGVIVDGAGAVLSSDALERMRQEQQRRLEEEREAAAARFRARQEDERRAAEAAEAAGRGCAAADEAGERECVERDAAASAAAAAAAPTEQRSGPTGGVWGAGIFWRPGQYVVTTPAKEHRVRSKASKDGELLRNMPRLTELGISEFVVIGGQQGQVWGMIADEGQKEAWTLAAGDGRCFITSKARYDRSANCSPATSPRTIPAAEQQQQQQEQAVITVAA